MILPTKHMPQEKALVTVGSIILKRLERQKTVSALWEEILEHYQDERNSNSDISFDWFVLALDFLYTIGAIEIHAGLLCRKAST